MRVVMFGLQKFYEFFNFFVHSIFIKFFRGEPVSDFDYGDDEGDTYDDFKEYHDEFLWETETDDPFE